MSQAEFRPRYSDGPLPPYSYVPGHAPHPVSDPRGHMHGLVHGTAPPLDPSHSYESAVYRYATDLFNHGFYWESHEAWETLWHAAGRQGMVASWLKGLIKLAAAAVKLREGNAAGAERHARRALELLNEVRGQLPAGQESYAGVHMQRVEDIAKGINALSAKITKADPALLLDWAIELPPDG
jgi:uncharacterized protein